MTSNHWEQEYYAERARLIETLGKITQGGVIESIQHIGATSVPGLKSSNCVDIAIEVWPFPVQESVRSKLQMMGYQAMEDSPSSSTQRFRHESGLSVLYLFDPGGDDWLNFTLLSDYLRHTSEACEQVSAKKADTALDKSALFASLLPDAHKWWIEYYGFSPLEKITDEFKDASFEWYVSSGWALDLFLGRVGRVHHDVDIIISYRSQMELQKYLTERGWKLLTPFEKRLEPWQPYVTLELPRHQIHAHRDNQFIDLLLTDMDTVWRYRREPSILRAKEKMSLKSERGIPYLAPELVLLFKSKNTSDRERSQDQTDFERAFSHLEPERRAWLYWAVTATSPEHSWVQQLK
jgi:GrpB-like predicted nucleotidyltransferase (UPF0157 family)